MKRSTTAILLALAMATSTGVYAVGADSTAQSGRGQPDKMMSGMTGPRSMTRLTKELALSSEQQDKIKAILDAARPRMDAIRIDRKNNRDTLMNADPGDANYATTVANARNVAADIASRMVTESSQLRASIWAVLTPEQRVKAKALRAQRADRTQGHRGRHGWRHGNPGDATQPEPPADPGS